MSFKVRLLLGAAVPIVFALPAAAQVQITTATTAPVATATANNGAAANIEITSAGAVTLDEQANSTAVTINSSNTVTNNGSINITDSNGATGVRITPGITGGYSGTGKINITEDFTRTDTDNDTDLDGPLAQGTGRAGILVDPGGTLNGSILLGTAGGVTVEGNNSFGISVQSVLNGDFRMHQSVDDGDPNSTAGDLAGASVTITGSNNVALDFREDITGNVGIGGLTQATGENSVGARFLGDVAGEFMVDGSIVATGFTSTTATNYEDPDTADTNDTGNDEPAKLDPDDLLVGGSALEIRGDLARGFLINGAAIGGTDPTDDVKDVVQDFNENRSAGGISSVGSATALVIQPLDGAASNELRLARVRETVRDTLDDDDDDNITEVIGVFDYDFGFINRGSIVGNGLNKGFSSNAVRIAGSADGLHQTIIEGGIFNGGSITALAFEANALGLNIGAGASSPQLVNSGGITAVANTQTNHNAIAVRIDAGASLPVVTNNGALSASVDSFDGRAIAFQDLSGTVTTFNNNSRVVAIFVDDVDDDIISGTGRAIALDLSHSASGITLTQNDTIDNARIFGDVLFGAGGDRFNLLSGQVFGDIDFGTGSDVFQINSASLSGDAIFRGANATMSLVGSQMEGDITLNNAAAALSFTGQSTFNGAITSTGGPVSMVVNDSTVNNSAAGTLNLNSLQLANNARLGFVINSARIAANTPIYNVTGVANVGANTVFTPIFEDFTNQNFTLRVLNASTLNLGGPVASMLNVNSPYLFNVNLVQPNANALDLVLSVKNEQQLGLNTRQAGAYDAILALMEEQSTVGAAITSIGTANEFTRAWSDLLPGSDAAVMELLAANATAAFGATAHRLDLITDKPDAPGGAWVEEFGVYHEGDSSVDGLAVSGGGFGVAAGLDLISTGSALIGAYASLESIEVDERNRTAAPLNVAQTTLGLYGGWQAGNFALNAAGGYGLINFTSSRNIAVGPVTDTLNAEWDGTSYNFAARGSYSIPLGFMNVKPFIAADYINVNEDGYAERRPATDLNDTPPTALIADSTESTLSSASYGVSFNANFGSDDAFTFKPELSVGYRNILTWEAPSAGYRFAGNQTAAPFFLHPGLIPEDGIVAGLGLNVESQFLNIKLGYDTEISDTATTHYGSITLRLAFW